MIQRRPITRLTCVDVRKESQVVFDNESDSLLVVGVLATFLLMAEVILTCIVVLNFSSEVLIDRTSYCVVLLYSLKL